MKNIEIEGKKISCEVKSKDVRYVYLKLRPDFSLHVTVPKNRDVDINKILEKKRPWLEKKVREISQKKKIFNENTVLYKGEQLEIETYYAKNPEKRIKLYRKSVVIYENPEKKKEEILREFLEKETMKYVQERIEEFKNELNVIYTSISTKDMKKWGYCTRDGKIFFNWRLICLPERIADYIIFHELLHLRYFNHSKQFKREMEKYFVDCKEIKKMLKRYYWT